jgi:oxygen-dependent protoporphyrinogen oxidase
VDSSPAESSQALVVGGGISGLLSARELSAAGYRVTVLEESGAWGGCVGSHTVAGITLDSGAESFATRSDAVASLAAELALDTNIVQPRPGGAWVQLPEGPRELPKTGVLGIPANPWDPEVRRSLGLFGALRASADRFLPASVGAGTDVASVAALVRARMGKRVLERLVAPVVGGVHSADPGMLDVDMVAPGLRAGLRREGSLAAAVSALRRGKAGGPAKAGAAVDLLAPSVPGIAGTKPGSGPDVKLVTLVIGNAALDSRPRGTGVLVAPQTPGIGAKALTHATGKWEWLREAAGPGRHVVRLSYGRADGDGGPEKQRGPETDEELLAAALHDASALLEVPIRRSDVVDWDVVRWRGSLPFAAVGHRARVASIREACSATGALAVVGGWVAGNGLAAVVSDTRTQLRNLLS